jgi:hypothetical protein
VSRDLSSGFTTEAAKAKTAPGYLLEIGFTSPLRLSSRADVTWNGNIWITWGFSVEGMQTDGTSSDVQGSITLSNTDNSIGTLLLQQGIADRSIKLWKFYGTAPGRFDPLPIISAAGNGATFMKNLTQVRITLMASGGRSLYSPRLYCTRENGFSILPPRGTIIAWNGEQFTLEAENG